MGLFGSSGGSTTSKTTRPDYIMNMVNGLSEQINNASVGSYNNLDYSGFNANQKAAYDEFMNNKDNQAWANDLIKSGQAGLDTLDNAYNQYAGLGDAYSTDALTNLTSQLYNRGDVENAINASNQASERQFSTETAPNVAQQANLSGGFGSAQRLGQARAQEALINEEQANAENISNNAYNQALTSAQSILASNDSNRRSALGSLTSNAINQAGNINTGAALQQNAYEQGLAATQANQQDRQNAMNNAYMNQQNANNWQYQDINNRLGAASVMNGVLGQTSKTTTSGGGAGFLGGAMSGAAAGSAFGPWGALAGAVIGGVASS
ncbi:TPA: hypothetical protein SCS57_002044 [Enterobacter cloacae]|nr:hypothetical protein [Enterobacter cloacae]